MADTPPPVLPTIEINPSAVRAILISLVTAISLVVSVIGSLAAFVSNRDLAGFVNWIKSEDFVQFIVAIGTIVSFATIIGRSLARKWREVYLARHVDDRIAVVKEPTPPPSI